MKIGMKVTAWLGGRNSRWGPVTEEWPWLYNWNTVVAYINEETEQN